MAKGDNLGEFEQLVLAALMMCGDDAYGLSIHRQIEKLTDGIRVVSLGACYITLGRLEQKGYVQSWYGGATEERKGKVKRFFEISSSGKQALKNALRMANNMVSGLREIGEWG